MQQDVDDKTLRQIDPNQIYLWKWLPSNGKSGGILVGINLEFLDVGGFFEGDFMLQMNLWDKKLRTKWNLITVYGAALEDRKDDFLAELANVCGKNKEPFIVGGDFNIIRLQHEKNKTGGTNRYSDTFNAIISTYELREINMTGGNFTWSNNQADPVLEKLDIILMSRDWEDLFPTVIVNKLPREVSDHNPLILHTDLSQPLNHLSFKFELAWLIQADFEDLVKNIWEKPCHAETAFDRIQIKLKRFKQYFKGWGFIIQGARRKRKGEIHSTLKEMEEEEEMGPLNLNSLLLRANLTTELMKILEEEEL